MAKVGGSGVACSTMVGGDDAEMQVCLTRIGGGTAVRESFWAAALIVVVVLAVSPAKNR